MAAAAAAALPEPPGAPDEQTVQTKLLAALVLFLVTLLCGYLPVRMILNQSYVQYAMFAGGGVLMATAFCHLIPEAHDNYRQPGRAPPANLTAGAPPEPLAGPELPYVELTLCCGFFFMYLVEQLMVRFVNTHTHEHPCDTSMGQLVVGVSLSAAPDRDPPPRRLEEEEEAAAGAFANDAASLSYAASQAALSQAAGAKLAGPASVGGALYKFLRGLLIVSAFGAHSIFDGVAIGSQDSVEKVWTIFLAISCHKLIIAAVVGLELFAATLESHLWTLVHLALFSIMSPIGIVLVVVAQSSLSLSSDDQAMVLLQSFATGTLLYIVFIEILQPKEERAYERNKLGKSVSLILGFLLMLAILTLIGHGHAD